MAGAATLKKPKEEARRPLPASAPARPPASTPRPRDPARGTILPVGAKSKGLVEITSSAFTPSEAVVEEIAASGSKGLDVRVIAKGLTDEGTIKVRRDSKNKFDSLRRGALPLLNPWTQKLGGMYLTFEIGNSVIKDGYASFAPKGDGKNEWLQTLRKDSTLLGGLGLKINSLPKPVNSYDGAKLVLGITGAQILVGGYVDAKFDLLLENMAAPKIGGSAAIDIKGAVKGELKFDSDGDKMKGSVALAVTFKSFSGSVNVTYKPDGTVDVSGKAAYSADKLSGEISFVATDEAAANKFAKDAIAAAGGKENVQNAGPPAPVPVAKEGQKKRALAATGQLSFNLTTWFAGTVNVVVDGKGAITVIGKIAPPGEITLFEQRDMPPKEIIKLEAKAYYGIPVVGNLNLFANISLHALAKLGPAKLYAIEILGTYSTDPEVQKSIQISGSLNISAYGGLRLRAEGGAGITILKHDLKFGIGLNADVGVKAYADARPTIGFRDPGVFYVSGTLDLVAQPILGLSGEFFIELDAPWFSPIDDDKWTWPLFSKEWPLGDPIGISASLKEYVLGSGKVPEITMKPPEFDPSKFMTNMVDDQLPNKSGGKGSGQGTFKDDGSVPKPVVPPKKPPPPLPATKPGKKGKTPAKTKSANPDTKAANSAKYTKLLEDASKPLDELKGKPSMTRSALDKELAKIKSKVSGISLAVASAPPNWLVTPKAGNLKGKDVKVGAAKAIEWWKDESPFKIGGVKKHRLFFKLEGKKAKLMMASTPRSIPEVLGDPDLKIDNLAALKTEYAAIDQLIAANSDIGTKTPAEQNTFQQSVHAKVDALAAKLAKYMKSDAKLPVSTITFGADQGRASYALGEPLTKNPGNTKGQPTTSTPLPTEGYRFATSFVPKQAKKPKLDRYGNTIQIIMSPLIQAHLINHELHGPYAPRNIALSDSQLNAQMKGAEGPAKTAAETEKISYRVTVVYHSDQKPPADTTNIPEPITETIQSWVGFYIAKEIVVKSIKWGGSAYSVPLTPATAKGGIPPVSGQIIESAIDKAMKLLKAEIDPTKAERKFDTVPYVATKMNRETLRTALGFNGNQMKNLAAELVNSGVQIGYGSPLVIWIKK